MRFEVFQRLQAARKPSGLTVLELLAVITIVIILALLLSGVLSRLPGAADRARCTQNLKNLYVGLSAYIDTNGHWPKQPDFSPDEQEKYEDFWIETLKPYGISEDVWKCPGITRLGKIKADGTSPRIHYSPTMFDQKPTTPRKWPTMPWVVEIGNAHGRGSLIILPDGSVHDYDTYVEQLLR